MAKTGGRAVRVSGRSTRLFWHEKTLREHHDKHAIREGVCWPDVLGVAPPVTRQLYEDASYDVVEDALLHVSVREDPEEDASERFVDGRLLQTITIEDVGDPELPIKTCFHKHYGAQQKHVVGAHQIGTPSQRVREHIKWIEMNIRCNFWDVKFRLDRTLD